MIKKRLIRIASTEIVENAVKDCEQFLEQTNYIDELGKIDIAFKHPMATLNDGIKCLYYAIISKKNIYDGLQLSFNTELSKEEKKQVLKEVCAYLKQRVKSSNVAEKIMQKRSLAEFNEDLKASARLGIEEVMGKEVVEIKDISGFCDEDNDEFMSFRIQATIVLK